MLKRSGSGMLEELSRLKIVFATHPKKTGADRLRRDVPTSQAPPTGRHL
jgi:hypothetical protein